MVYCNFGEVNDLTNVTSSDILDVDITKIIAKATIELNRKINVKVEREKVGYIDSTRTNKINGSNTIYYFKNWKGKFLADMNNDGTVTTSDIIVYLISQDGTETTATVSAVDHDNMYFTLTTAPDSSTTSRMEVTYEWCFKDVSTPDPIVKLACIFLTASYCYGKLNIGMAPKQKWGSQTIERDMKSPEYYRQMAYSLINDINDEMYSSADSVEAMK